MTAAQSQSLPPLVDTALRAFDGLLDALETRMPPPAWAVQEAQQKIVLLLNHILQNEAEAMARLKRQNGQRVHFSWRSFKLNLKATPVGLVDLDEATASPSLSLTLTQAGLPEIAASLAAKQTPPMRIEGDVQLAAEVAWLTQHVKWDVEDDLARIIGNVPAHTLGQAARAFAAALKPFLATSQTTPDAPKA
jgi:ubiquinone biosynthesis accessory factor UbiJ